MIQLKIYRNTLQVERQDECGWYISEIVNLDEVENLEEFKRQL